MKGRIRAAASILAVFAACGEHAAHEQNTSSANASDGGVGERPDAASSGSHGDGDTSSPEDAGHATEHDASTRTPSDDAGGPGEKPAGIACDMQFTVEGLTGCQTTVDGIDVKFFPLAEGHAVKHLAVYLHQDEADDWYENWAFPPIAEWTVPRDIMIVAPLAPSLYEDGTHGYGAAGTVDTVLQVGPVLQKFMSAYGASPERSYYWGRSGGSWFMASWFIPQFGQKMPGIFVPSCGGDVSNFMSWAWSPEQRTSKRDATSILFNYGAKDFLAQAIEQGIAEYRQKGFHVESLVDPQAEHCQHAIDEPTLAFWSKYE